jgi:hypothetical protein
MPKNFGVGVTPTTRRTVGRALVRLGRRDLWQRLDRSMIHKSRGDRAGSAAPVQRVR